MELEQQKADFEKRGVRVATLSYDGQAILQEFASRKKITFPMLSDPQSRVIRQFGILNETIAPDNAFYGIPIPGSYLIDASGKVVEKYFEPDYRERFSAGTVLVRQFGETPGEALGRQETNHLTATYSASAPVIRPGQRISLVVELQLKPKMHVYTPGVQEPYIPISWKGPDSAGWKSEQVTWPAPRILHLPAIDESVPVYEGRVRLVRDLLVVQQKELEPLVKNGQVTLESTLRYQACDDRLCYPPQNLTLRWTLPVEMHDRTRSPEPIRHKF